MSNSNFIEVVDKVKQLTGSNLTYAQFAAVFKDAMVNSTLSKDRLGQLKEESKSLAVDKKEDVLKGIGNYITARKNGLVLTSNEAPVTNVELPDNKVIQKIAEIEIQSESPTQLNQNYKINSNELKVITSEKAPLNNEDKDRDKDKINLQQPTDNEVKQYVIPVVADKIASYGKSDVNKDSITYENENFTAMLRLGDEEQRITLDRKNASPDTANALSASKGNKEQEYQIVLNNLTRDEFDRFKALFEKANQEKNNTNKEQRQSEGEGLG